MVDEERFRQLWEKGFHKKDIGRLMNISLSRVYETAGRLRLRRDPPPETPEREEDCSPSLEEIAERAAEIRSGWDDKETEKRLVGNVRSKRWSPPSYTREQVVGGR